MAFTLKRICQEFNKNILFLFSEDHAIGLSTFTIMAGLGGSLGYAMGGFDWGVFGNFVKTTSSVFFWIITFIFGNLKAIMFVFWVIITKIVHLNFLIFEKLL